MLFRIFVSVSRVGALTHSAAQHTLQRLSNGIRTASAFFASPFASLFLFFFSPHLLHPFPSCLHLCIASSFLTLLFLHFLFLLTHVSAPVDPKNERPSHSLFGGCRENRRLPPSGSLCLPLPSILNARKSIETSRFQPRSDLYSLVPFFPRIQQLHSVSKMFSQSTSKGNALRRRGSPRCHGCGARGAEVEGSRV